jgi:hypothetical protein
MILIKGLCPTGTDSDLLPPETNPAIVPWRDSRRYDSEGGGSYIKLVDEPVLKPGDTLQIQARGWKDDPIWFAISAIFLVEAEEYERSTRDIHRAYVESIDGGKFTEEELQEHAELMKQFETPWMRRREPVGDITLNSMVGSDGVALIRIQGGNACIGELVEVRWKVTRTCVLHNVLRQVVKAEVGVVTVFESLRVYRNGEPRTPSLFLNDTELADDFHKVGIYSSLKGSPILIAGDVVVLEVGAFAPDEEKPAAEVLISLLTHSEFGQYDVSALLDHLAEP